MDNELNKIREKKKEAILKNFGKPVEITDANFSEMLNKYELMIVDFWAAWCMPCRLLAPVIEELSREYSGKIVFGKLNVDENRESAQKFNIMSIPSLLFFKEGKLVNRLIGALPKEHIKAEIDKFIKDKY